VRKCLTGKGLLAGRFLEQGYSKFSEDKKEKRVPAPGLRQKSREGYDFLPGTAKIALYNRF
jgi:hypothetical protein